MTWLAPPRIAGAQERPVGASNYLFVLIYRKSPDCSLGDGNA